MHDVVGFYKENTEIIVDTFTLLGFNVYGARTLLMCGCTSLVAIRGMCSLRSLRRRTLSLRLAVDLDLAAKAL